MLLATEAAVLVGYRLLLGSWPWATPVAAAVQRVVLAAVAAAAVASLLTVVRVPAWTGGVLVAVAVAAAMTWAVAGYPTPAGVARSAFWSDRAGGATVLAVVLFAVVEPVAARSPGPAAAWVCGCLSAGLGILQLFSAYTQTGMVTAALGTAIGGTFVVAATGYGPRLNRGPVAVWVVLLVGLLAANRLGGGDMPTRPLLVLGLAPVLAWVGEAGPFRRWKPWQRELLRGAVVAVPVAVAIAMAVAAHNAEADANGGY